MIHGGMRNENVNSEEVFPNFDPVILWISSCQSLRILYGINAKNTKEKKLFCTSAAHGIRSIQVTAIAISLVFCTQPEYWFWHGKFVIVIQQQF